jgi:predicted RNase H-like HicB family nuclease
MKIMSEYIIPITVEELKEGGFLATSLVLQGLIAQGRTVAETMEIAEDVARKIIDSMIERNDPLPAAILPKKRPKKKSFRSFKLETKIPVGSAG